MAAHINTNQEGENGEEFDFDKWISDNNLNNIKHLLTKHKMNTVDTLNTNSQEFQHLMSDPQLLTFTNISNIIPIFFAALQKISTISRNKTSKIIVISEEEEQSRIKLDEFNNNNEILIKKLNETSNKLTKNIKQCDSKIDTSFNELHQQIENKKKEIKIKLKKIEKQKRSEINAKSQTLNKEKLTIKNAIKSCNSLVEDVDMDRIERKKKIVSISNNINEELSNKNDDIKIDITFTFNKDIISSFISNLCDVYDDESHPIISITKLHCKSITQTEATVHFNASLSKQDMNKKLHSTLYMKVECVNNDMDEKEKEALNSSMIEFNKNKSNYNYTFKGLMKNKNYIININIYESQNNNKQPKKRKDYKPIYTQFKTLLYEIDKHFIYKSDFDTNGICYALGSNYGKKIWQNPAEQGLIIMKSSGWGGGDIKYVVGREMKNSNTTNTANSWISIDFQKLQIKPTTYTLRHDTNTTNFLRNWSLDGSNNGTDWTTLKKHVNDESINGKGATFTWNIDNCHQSYRMFRIRMDGPCSTNQWHLLCSGFELYGHLTK